MTPDSHRGAAGGGARPGGHEDAAGGADDVTLATVLDFLHRHRRMLLIVPLLAGTAALVYSLLTDRTYTASAAFMPQTSGNASGLLGAAAQLGISVPGESSTESPAFYAALVQSRQLLSETAASRFSIQRGDEAETGTIAEFYEIEGGPRVREAEAIGRLREALRLRTTRETGIVHVTVQTRWPDLSAAVLDRLLELVNEFNLQRRQTQASAERRFVEAQLAEARQQLTAAEDQLQAFMTRNRQFRNSAELTFDYERLNREVERRNRVVGSLSEAYEQARVDEVRNIPVITVLDPPVVPIEPDARGTTVRIIGAGLVGLLIALALAFIADAARALGITLPGRRSRNARDPLGVRAGPVSAPARRPVAEPAGSVSEHDTL